MYIILYYSVVSVKASYSEWRHKKNGWMNGKNSMVISKKKRACWQYSSERHFSNTCEAAKEWINKTKKNNQTQLTMCTIELYKSTADRKLHKVQSWKWFGEGKQCILEPFLFGQIQNCIYEICDSWNVSVDIQFKTTASKIKKKLVEFYISSQFGLGWCCV